MVVTMETSRLRERAVVVRNHLRRGRRWMEGTRRGRGWREVSLSSPLQGVPQLVSL